MSEQAHIPNGFIRFEVKDHRGTGYHPLTGKTGILIVRHVKTDRRYIYSGKNLSVRISGINHELKNNKHTLPSELFNNYQQSQEIEFYYQLFETSEAAKVARDKLYSVVKNDPRYYNKQKAIKAFYATPEGRTLSKRRGNNRPPLTAVAKQKRSSSNAMPCRIDNVEYPSLSAAERELNISKKLIRYLIDSESSPNFTFI